LFMDALRLLNAKKERALSEAIARRHMRAHIERRASHCICAATRERQHIVNKSHDILNTDERTAHRSFFVVV